MNQLRHFLLSVGVAALGSFTSTGQSATLIDDFDRYNNSSMIQAQNNAWRILGTAAVDGVYSVANGVGGTRGASIILDYKNGNTNGSTRYTFTEPQHFETEITFSIDIALSVVVPGTAVTAQISNSLGDAASIYEFNASQGLTGTSYQTYTFTLNSATTRRVQGAASFDNVLADLKNVTFRFVNLEEQGKQTVYFDNLTYTAAAIPEPSLVTFSFLGGAAIWAVRRFRLRTQSGV